MKRLISFFILVLATLHLWAEDIELTSVEALTTQYFVMAYDDQGTWKSPFWTEANRQNVMAPAASATTCGGDVNYYLLKAEAVTYNDETVYRISISNSSHQLFPAGINGGSFLNYYNSGYFSGNSTSPDYGEDNPGKGVFKITYTEGKGFQFQNVYEGSSGVKYINYSMGHSTTANKYYWHCFAEGSLYDPLKSLRSSSAYQSYTAMRILLSSLSGNDTDITTTTEARTALNSALSTAAAAVEAATTEEAILEATVTLRRAGTAFLQTVTLAEGAQINITPLIINATFSQNDAVGWMASPAPGFQSKTNAEYFSKSYDFNQTLPDMPQATYLLRVQAFWRSRSNAEKTMTDYVNGVTTSADAYLYGDNEQTAIANIGRDALSINACGGSQVTINETDYWLPKDMSSAAMFFGAGQYWNTLTVHHLTTGDMTIGLRSAVSTYGTWTCFDSFELYIKNGDSTVSDLTSLLTNPSFEDGTTTGWMVGKPGGADTGAKQNTGVYSTTGTDGDYLFNAYAHSESYVYDTPVHYVEQTLGDCRAGEYRLCALAASSTYSNGANTPVELYANSSVVSFVPQSKTSFADHELTFFLSPSESAITFGMRSASWFKADNFRLIYYGQTEAYEENRRLATANRYEEIAAQAIDRSAYDAVLADVKATLLASNVTDDEIDAANNRLREALLQLVSTGTTTSGQFDITALLEDRDMQQARNTTAATTLSETLAEMPAGHYTLRTNAFYRPSETAAALEAYERGEYAQGQTDASLFIDKAAVPVPDIFSGARHAVSSNVDYYAMIDGRGVPTTESTAIGCFLQGQYDIAVETDLTAKSDLTIGFTINATEQSQNWLISNGLQLLYGAVPNTTVAKSISAGELTPICLPVNLNSSEVGQLYTVAAIDGTTATLYPVSNVRAGQPCVVCATADISEFTLPATQVSTERPDIVPLPWTGGSITGSYDNYSWMATDLDGITTTAAEDLTFVVADPVDADFTVNLENLQVRRFLQLEDYTATTASRIATYNVAPPARRDQANAVAIPLQLPCEGDYTISLSDNAGSISVPEREIVLSADRQTLYIAGLIPQKDYSYTVTANGQAIAAGRFHTKGRLRQLYLPSISNVRDMGGWLTTDKQRVRYGLIYRGGELNGDHIATNADRQTLLDLGIGAEIDLRIDYDNSGAGKSAFGFSQAEGTYYYANANDFHTENMTSAESHARWKAEFDLLLATLRAGNSVYFHCIWGADRTGLFSLLLEGLLGIPEEESNKNYELTTFSLAGTRWRGSQDAFFAHIKSLNGATLQQQFATFFRESLGASQEDIDDFRQIMLVPAETTVVRTASAPGTYGTICLPYDATVEGATLYTVTGVDDAAAPTTLYIEPAVTTLEAGVAYIYESTTAGDVVFTINGDAHWTEVRANQPLIGTYAAVKATAGTYVLSKGLWHRVVEGDEPTIGAYRAYLNMNAINATNGAVKAMPFYENNTGIIEVADSQRRISREREVTYDLQGRRVYEKRIRSGLYIVKGKKVMQTPRFFIVVSQ